MFESGVLCVFVFHKNMHFAVKLDSDKMIRLIDRIIFNSHKKRNFAAKSKKCDCILLLFCRQKRYKKWIKRQ